MSRPGLSVIIFAFNEEANIVPVLTELRAWLADHEPSAEVVFVDDGSSDETSAAAAKALAGTTHQLLRHETNRGIGAALKTGVRAAKGDWVTFLPADGQIAPDAIGTMRAAAAHSLSDSGHSRTAEYANTAARALDDAGYQLLSYDVGRLVDDAADVVRRHPALSAAVAAAAGYSLVKLASSSRTSRRREY